MQRLHTKANLQKKRFLATRSARAVTFYLRSSPGTPPIQVITSTHESTQDILLHFDLDSACFAYSPTEGERVVCTPRGLRALQYSANIVHGSYSGPNYCRRLETYSQRGFVVALPGYAPSKVSPNFLSGTYAQFRGRDSLYRLGPKRHRMETVQITHVDHNSSSAKSECVRVAAMQSARAVIDVQRLIVLDRLAPITLDPPEVQFCAKHERYYVDEARINHTCTPLAVGLPREYVLMWGATEGPRDEEAEDSDDSLDVEGGDGFYEVTPLAAINRLLKKHTDRLLDTDDGPCVGGALHRTLARQVSTGATRMAYDTLTQQLANSLGARTKLRLVYDFVPFGAEFEEGLSWVRNARRSPLRADWADEVFEEAYGLEPQLTFKRRTRREPRANDFWVGIY